MAGGRHGDGDLIRQDAVTPHCAPVMAGEQVTPTRRGDVHRQLGDERRAAADWAAAGALFEQARSPRAEEARRRLGNSRVRSGDGELD